MCAAQGPANPGEPISVGDLTQYAHYFARVVEELMAVLFDVRRHTCHSLVLNYFVAGGGLNVLVGQFHILQQLMWQELELKEQSHNARTSAGKPMLCFASCGHICQFCTLSMPSSSSATLFCVTP